jgi:hypothetical protein
LSRGANTLDSPVSYTDGFLSRDTFVFSTLLNRSIGTKRAFLHVEIYDFQEGVNKKTNPFSHESNVPDAPVSK